MKHDILKSWLRDLSMTKVVYGSTGRCIDSELTVDKKIKQEHT
ncbi:hypothetical protein ACLIBG_03640 [Virgibacillus sp. W0181]